jgi:membrane associated rhomboid family serine protease
MEIIDPSGLSNTENRDSPQKDFHLRFALKSAFFMVALIWVIQIILYITMEDPGNWGIEPRSIWGFKRILTGPLVHGDWGHIASNTPPLFVSMLMILYFYPRIAIKALLMSYILTGFIVWIVARPSSHIGASGIVYAWISFIFWTGYFRRNIRALALTGIVAILYGGMMEGVLPSKPNVSWESHLIGVIVGLFTAYWYKTTLEEAELQKKQESIEPKKFYFAPDVFEKTRAQRAYEKEQELLRLQEIDRLEKEEKRRKWLEDQAGNGWTIDHTGK